jgi:hypothetical protein
MTLLADRVGLLGLNPDGWSDEPVRCFACGLYSDPEAMVASVRGGVCEHCAEYGEVARGVRRSGFDLHIERRLKALKFIEVSRVKERSS